MYAGRVESTGLAIDGSAMAIKKQEFYEGAALFLIARTGKVSGLKYQPPFFLINDRLWVLLKYSTKSRSPWGFTFTADEQEVLQLRAGNFKTAIGLICGSDGVATLPYESYLKVATPRKAAIRIACFRNHGEYYEVSGPDGSLDKKVSPSGWQKLLEG
jgi:hypothetical protein